MQIILQEDVEKLGTRGQLVEVAEGYARNFLLPRKLALEASAADKRRRELRNRAGCEQGDGHPLSMSAEAGDAGDTAQEYVRPRRKAGVVQHYFVASEIGQRERACKCSKLRGQEASRKPRSGSTCRHQ